MKHVLMIALIVLFTGAVYAQPSASDAAEVQQVIENLFEAMKASDGNRLNALFADNAKMNTIGTDPDGKAVVNEVPVQAFIQRVSGSQPGMLNERILNYNIQVDGDLASVWTPYEFYYGDEFSHCGSNSFQLFRDPAQGWQIIYIIDTRKREGCS